VNKELLPIISLVPQKYRMNESLIVYIEKEYFNQIKNKVIMKQFQNTKT